MATRAELEKVKMEREATMCALEVSKRKTLSPTFLPKTLEGSHEREREREREIDTAMCPVLAS